ncbi:pectate lyase [Flavobacterium agrisoli]|uniref:Pectate lyase n=1 Tax=Flavobacterium agrisoli TaxID=2793066 RepID=A0A934UK85_9FLAO|nr:pectate lyase [Flavobacterium agrisoli]MBK0370200.1 pectate lyase [Flavobacterium agrisoli]
MKKITAVVKALFVLLVFSCSSDPVEKEVKVSSIVINGDNVVGAESKQLSVTVSPSSATNKEVTWNVSDKNIAVITETGLLTGLKNGSVKVTATAKDGSGVISEKNYTVSGIKDPVVLVESISINNVSITDGKPVQLTAGVLPATATNKELVWTVSNDAIATISAEGIITPKINGTIIVTATAKDGSGKSGQLQLVISGVTIVYQTTVRGESILLWQRNNGGWGKAVADLNLYNTQQTAAQITTALNSKNLTDTTIDNGHVVTELRWLLADYKTTQNPNYLAAAEKAIDWLFAAQYANGGWPQYYPDKSGYRHQITYNDNAIANVMNLMWDITKSKNNLDLVNEKYKEKAQTAFNKGIEVILKTQITYKGKKTVWCAQHDEVTLLPALARAYELPSFSGSESVGIVRVLMLVEQPSAEVKQAIKDAIDWFNGAKLFDIATKKISDASQPSGQDLVVVASPGSVLWARFYDLENNQPFFCGRDGVAKKTLAEIENERRVGYAWYGNWPSTLIDKDYPSWKAKNGL